MNARFPFENYSLTLAWLVRTRVMKYDAVIFEQYFGLGGDKMCIYIWARHTTVLHRVCAVIVGQCSRAWDNLCMESCLKHVTFSCGLYKVQLMDFCIDGFLIDMLQNRGTFNQCYSGLRSCFFWERDPIQLWKMTRFVPFQEVTSERFKGFVMKHDQIGNLRFLVRHFQSSRFPFKRFCDSDSCCSFFRFDVKHKRPRRS
jgi:hypothetical protein